MTDYKLKVGDRVYHHECGEGVVVREERKGARLIVQFLKETSGLTHTCNNFLKSKTGRYFSFDVHCAKHDCDSIRCLYNVYKRTDMYTLWNEMQS